VLRAGPGVLRLGDEDGTYRMNLVGWPGGQVSGNMSTAIGGNTNLHIVRESGWFTYDERVTFQASGAQILFVDGSVHFDEFEFELTASASGLQDGDIWDLSNVICFRDKGDWICEEKT
jgi:prepilin-type processing-associated H-X9-DG protein